MNKVCILSFGNSAKYRLPVEQTGAKDISAVRADVKEYLKRKFPQLDAGGFYDKVSVEELTDAETAGYPVFNESALDSIKSVLGTEVRDYESLSKLNLNAPFNDKM